MSDDHRPGPWQLSKYRDGSSIIVIDAEGFDVCAVHYPNRDATARLIASAPDMAAEIERLRGEVAQLRGLISAVNEDEWYRRVSAYEHQIATLRQRARLPDELVERIRRDSIGTECPTWARLLLRDILAWNESGGEPKA